MLSSNINNPIKRIIWNPFGVPVSAIFFTANLASLHRGLLRLNPFRIFTSNGEI